MKVSCSNIQEKWRPLLEMPSAGLFPFMLRLGPWRTFTGGGIIFSTFDHSHLLFEITPIAPRR